MTTIIITTDSLLTTQYIENELRCKLCDMFETDFIFSVEHEGNNDIYKFTDEN